MKCFSGNGNCHLFLVVFFLGGVAANLSIQSSRSIRATGDAAPAGQCMSFSRGGSTGLHFYACCNNCNDPCDSHTYQSASSGEYCSSCGRDNSEGNGKIRSSFLCGGCNGQNTVANQCSSGLWNSNRIPEFCRVFVLCFEHKCKDQAPSTCFNKICEPTENTANCPVDCCAKKNPGLCTIRDDYCPPECCATSSCCPFSVATRASLTTLTTFWIFSLLAFVWGFTRL